MIRDGTVADIPRILSMGVRFYEAAGWSEFVTWDDASVDRTLRSLIEADHGALIVAEVDGEVVGMTAGMVVPHYCNLNTLTGQELFWWVDPEHRGVGVALLDALEGWAKAAGAAIFTMVAVHRIKPEVMARVYRARGYAPAEHSHIRRL